MDTTEVRERALHELRVEIDGGKLRLLVGAGPSIAAGLPNWDTLNRRLLQQYLGSKYRDLELGEHDLDVMSHEFVAHFGRDAVVDVVRMEAKRMAASSEPFDTWLEKALYGFGQIQLDAIQYELVAAARAVSSRTRDRQPACLYTLNYDDTLERAQRELFPDRNVMSVYDASTPDGDRVVHLHGLLRAGETPRGSIVLSERDYYATDDAWAADQLRQLLLDGDQTVLMVGLSLADPRLRKILLDRLERKRSSRPVPLVYAFLTENHCEDDADLIERLTHNFIRRHAAEYWRRWDIRALPLRQLALLPYYLRRIRLGDDIRVWASKGHHFLKESSRHLDGDLESIYRREVQSWLFQRLDRARRIMAARFQFAANEVVHIGCFLPTEDGGHLKLAFHLRTDDKDSRLDAEAASLRMLELQDVRIDRSDKGPQGAAGLAFVMGAVHRSTPATVNAHFTREQVERWERDRTFNSLLCVPVYDSPDWVPIGVMYVSSNLGQPFWERTETDPKRVQTLLLALFRELLNYERRTEGVSGGD